MGVFCRTTRMAGAGAAATGIGAALTTGLPKPVATTVTRIWFAMSGSMTVPTTTVASSDANCLMTLPTSWNSPIDRSIPAVTFTRMPWAPERLMSSSSGLEIAASAASRARSSPAALPDPIIAIPVSDMTVRTSAKSTLIKPGRVISSAIPCTAPCSTVLAALNASSNVVVLPSTVSSFWFGMVISESTYLDSSSMPCSATRERLLPSISKGLVTTATVRMPSSLATCATTGAAPVPVPPPIPAVMNSISQPSMSSMMRSRSSMAAWRPTSGSAPAPTPLGMLQPICRAVRTFECFNACASVLMQMKSTPSRPACTMCETALPPPPPTPSTLMTAFWLYVSISSNIPSLLIDFGKTAHKLHKQPLKIALKPGLHSLENILHSTREQRCLARKIPLEIPLGVEQQPHARRMNRIADHVNQTADVLRHAQAHGHVEHFLGQLDGPFHLGTAAGEHDARGHLLLQSGAPQLIAD